MGCPLFRPLANETDPTLSYTKKKVLLIGLDGSGKTTILHRLKSGKFQQTLPTVGLNIETALIKNIEFLIFDVGGKVRSLWTHYYENLNALIFVIDSTDKERMWQVREELVKLNEDLKFQNVSLLVFFNKQDLKDRAEFNDLIEWTGVKEVLEMDIIVQKCSALNGEGLNEGIEKLINFMENANFGKVRLARPNSTFTSNSFLQKKN